jgi:hypothetical protein
VNLVCADTGGGNYAANQVHFVFLGRMAGAIDLGLGFQL